MSTDIFTPIHTMVLSETDPVRRSRLEQFIYATVCAWPQFSIHHAAQAAIQLARPAQIYRLGDFEAVAHIVKHIDLRSGQEWEVLGYFPIRNALPILLSNPDDDLAPPVVHYLREDVRAPETGTYPSYMELPSQVEQSEWWRQRRTGSGPRSESTYRGFHPAFTDGHARMLGNLWKIGAVATWERDSSEAASWAELPHPPVEGAHADPDVTEHDAWYHFRIGSHLGRDSFAEIALCLGNVFCHHLPQVWRENSSEGLRMNDQVIMLESEAAGSIAVNRLGGPARRGDSFFGNALLDSDNPLPDDFHLPTVLHAADQIQALLQGDTRAVTAAAWFADDPRS